MTLIENLSPRQRKEFEGLIAGQQKVEAVKLLRSAGPYYVDLGHAVTAVNKYVTDRAAKIGGVK